MILFILAKAHRHKRRAIVRSTFKRYYFLPDRFLRFFECPRKDPRILRKILARCQNSYFRFCARIVSPATLTEGERGNRTCPLRRNPYFSNWDALFNFDKLGNQFHNSILRQFNLTALLGLKGLISEEN